MVGAELIEFKIDHLNQDELSCYQFKIKHKFPSRRAGLLQRRVPSFMSTTAQEQYFLFFTDCALLPQRIL